MKSMLKMPMLTLALILTFTQCNERFPDIEVRISDENFLQALIELGVDSNGDGIITYSEAYKITYLDVSGKGIRYMGGIEDFRKLDTLKCGSAGSDKNYIHTLNFFYSSSLKYLDCSNNLIDSLVLPDYQTCVWLDCSGNQLSDLDLSFHPLNYLSCENNLLTTLNIPVYDYLTFLNCGNNQITTLDLSNNSSLEQLGLEDMPSLHEVCVWTMPFPPDGVDLDTNGSPNVYFTTECSN